MVVAIRTEKVIRVRTKERREVQKAGSVVGREKKQNHKHTQLWGRLRSRLRGW